MSSWWVPEPASWVYYLDAPVGWVCEDPVVIGSMAYFHLYNIGVIIYNPLYNPNFLPGTSK